MAWGLLLMGWMSPFPEALCVLTGFLLHSSRPHLKFFCATPRVTRWIQTYTNTCMHRHKQCFIWCKIITLDLLKCESRLEEENAGGRKKLTFDRRPGSPFSLSCLFFCVQSVVYQAANTTGRMDQNHFQKKRSDSCK